MILDALVSVNPFFKFAENITSPNEYMKFTDDLIKYIAVTQKS